MLAFGLYFTCKQFLRNAGLVTPLSTDKAIPCHLVIKLTSGT